MQPRHPHFNAYLALLVILILVGGFLYGLYAFFGVGAPAPAPQSTTTVPQNIPPPTPADQISAQQPFQYLISYTVSGFHPTTLSIQKGQTVRFTDNSPESIAITGAGTKSPTLQQGTYWQYTATKAGTVTFTAGNSSVQITAD